MTLHPLVLGLIQNLPPPGSIWPKAKRAQWLLLAERCLDLLYEEDKATAQHQPAADEG